jgi:hypothetical protein
MESAIVQAREDLILEAAEIVIAYDLSRADVERAARIAARRTKHPAWTCRALTDFVAALQQIAARRAR